MLDLREEGMQGRWRVSLQAAAGAALSDGTPARAAAGAGVVSVAGAAGAGGHFHVEFLTPCFLVH